MTPNKKNLAFLMRLLRLYGPHTEIALDGYGQGLVPISTGVPTRRVIDVLDEMHQMLLDDYKALNIENRQLWEERNRQQGQPWTVMDVERVAFNPDGTSSVKVTLRRNRIQEGEMALDAEPGDQIRLIDGKEGRR